jgi:hypothetical protein
MELIDDESDKIADLLLGLTRAQNRWGVRLCFLDMRTVWGHGWNQIWTFHIYRWLELTPRITPPSQVKMATKFLRAS